jgi:hydroxymethylbilane synthase
MATTLSPTASAPPLTTTSIKADTSKQINIGTRKSALAMIQTELVLADLHRHSPSYSYTVHAMSTMGDKNQVTPLHDFGAKSLWTHELEAQLLDGQLDMIVHSLKGFCIFFSIW